MVLEEMDSPNAALNENDMSKNDTNENVRCFTFLSRGNTPEQERVTKITYDLISEHHYNWSLPRVFYSELFYRVFGVPLKYHERHVSYEDGKIEMRDYETFQNTFKIKRGEFQKLYDKSFACIYVEQNYLLFYDGAIVGVSTSLIEEFMTVCDVFSNLEPETILPLFEGLEKYDEKVDKRKYGIALFSRTSGFRVIEQTLKKMEVDVKKTYNDDIPYERMKNILSTDGKSLMLFYGEPGTGKTTLIKKLISETNRKFIFMDASSITNISDDMFINFLSENVGRVIVLEDCEKLLVSRDSEYNHTIGTLLNLTDGVIGDSFEVKFICTFNSDVKRIDEALLRKGRLSLKYEFKKLALNKVKAIFPDAEDDMTVADAYNAMEENDFSKEKRGKIGF